MRAVVQRVAEASVEVNGVLIGAIGKGLLVLVGVEFGDNQADVAYMAEKIAGLRIFNDAAGKFNFDLEQAGGAILLVSQFTLHGDCRRGRRPSFTAAAPPEEAIPLYESLADILRHKGFRVGLGEFGADMQVRLLNDGPVTILLDSRKQF